MNICVIPARGGSKRIPRKNCRYFCGKPIIAWSIVEALQSKLFDKVIVSTDDKEIADIATFYGAEVPYLRSEKLSGDHVPTYPVILDLINYLLDKELKPQFICCLYATSPFTKKSDLLNAYKILRKEKLNSYVFAATSFSFPLQRAIRLDENGYSIINDPSFIGERSQDLEKYYHDAGQFYFARLETWLSNKDFFYKGKPLLIPRWRVEDIDNEEDWIRAEKLFKII